MKIKGKILSAILGTAFSVLLLWGIFTILSYGNINGDLQEVSGQVSAKLGEESKQLLESANTEITTELAHSYSTSINENFLKIKNQVLTVSNYVERLYEDRENAVQREMDLSSGIMLMPDVDMEKVQEDYNILYTLGDLIQSEPDHNVELVDLYILTANGLGWDGSDVDYRGTVDYDFREVENAWYQDAVQAGTIVWSDVFLGDVTGTLKISCSNPVYDQQKNLIGVVTAGISINHIYESVLGKKDMPYDAALLLDENGEIMVNPDECDPEEIKKDPTKVVAYAPIEETGWSLCIIFPFQEINEVTNALETAIDEQGIWLENALAQQVWRAVKIALLLAVLLIAVIIPFSRTLSKTITTPLEILTREVAEIGSGNLERRVEIHSGDEVEELANRFNIMVTELKEYMDNLEVTTKEKQKIESELNVAKNIQESMLPKIFPKFCHQEGYEIAASMDPAKEVGGDFFDIFYIGDDKKKLAFLVADVSGKGIPAALFMVISKTLLKNHILVEENLEEAVRKANNQLQEGNTQLMFVTAFVAVLNLETGELEWVNAGHNPPLFCRKEKEFSYLDIKRNIVLAVRKRFSYEKETIFMNPGDKIFLYTDGVTEANNNKEELFGEDRLKDVLNSCKEQTPENIRAEVFGQLKKYSEGVSQFDDITMLLLQYQGLDKGEKV